MLMFYFKKARAYRAAALAKRADGFRNSGNFLQAAALYKRAAHATIDRPDLYVQLGNMLKDSGQYAEAVKAYEAGHNGFVELFGARETDWVVDQLADVLLQLGHAFKLAGARDHAVHFYRKSNDLRPIESFEHEVNIASLTLHGISDSFHDLPTPKLLEWNAGSLNSATERFGSKGRASLLPETSHDFLCYCWSTEGAVVELEHDDGHFVACRYCGSVNKEGGSGMVVRQNLIWVPNVEISIGDIENILSSWSVDIRLGKIGLIGAHVNYSETSDRYTVETLPLMEEGVQSGLYRCSYDAVIIWKVSNKVGQIRDIVEQAHQLIRPNGILVVGYAPLSAIPLLAEVFRNKVEQISSLGKSKSANNRVFSSEGRALRSSVATTVGGGPISDLSAVSFLSDYALHSLLEPMKRDGAIFTNRHRQSLTHHFLAMKKSGVMDVGIMSGIGDAVWSFVIQAAIRDKYGATALRYHVNDSGDGRRKRSNNMLARFKFVDDMVTAPFKIHADPAMDPKSGHLNYMPSGPVRVRDPHYGFDYFMVVNSFLEHGWDYRQISRSLELDHNNLDFDFFKQYKEEPGDLEILDKVKHYAGSDYAIFYYGAEVDNTVGGLNRDELWRPQDWNKLGRLINEAFGLKIIVIGAPYDASYANKILASNDDLFYFNTIGQLDITATLSLIQRARFMIAFPAGVGIVGPYMRVPTAIFWRPQYMSYHVMHDRAGFSPDFATDWVPPSVLEDGQYYPAWYGIDTPEKIFEIICTRGWAKRPIPDQIGKW